MTFKCPLDLLFVSLPPSGFSESDIAEAVSSAKEYLTKGQLSTTIPVVRQDSGRYEIQANVGTFVAAHILGIDTLLCRENL